MSPRMMVLIVFVVSGITSVQAQQSTVKHVPIQRTSAASGEQMFVNYCAVCHGKDGKGDGPAASSLKTSPADLTRLASNNQGKFPGEKIVSTLKFGTQVPAHGTSDMPIWGEAFKSLNKYHSGEVDQRIANLTDYIKSLQGK